MRRSLSVDLRSPRLAAVGLTLLLAPLAGCGVFDGGGAPEPVAVVDQVTGRNTAIKLDKGFVGALEQLKLTPGVDGGAKLKGGSLIFPITGGNVTVFEQGAVSPYVVGQIQHENSGLTLSAGGTTVLLSNFNVDPGSSKVYGDVPSTTRSPPPARSCSTSTAALSTLEAGDGTVTLQGTKVLVSEVAAPLLNDTFGTKAVEPGLLVGAATITVKTS